MSSDNISHYIEETLIYGDGHKQVKVKTYRTSPDHVPDLTMDFFLPFVGTPTSAVRVQAKLASPWEALEYLEDMRRRIKVVEELIKERVLGKGEVEG